MDYKNGLKECSGCGFSLPKDASICPYCGTRFIDDGTEEKKTQTEYSKIQNTSIAEKNEKWIQEWVDKFKSSRSLLLVTLCISLVLLLLFVVLLIVDKKVVSHGYGYFDYHYVTYETKEGYIYLATFMFGISLIALGTLTSRNLYTAVCVKKIDGDTYLAYNGYAECAVVKNGVKLDCKRTTYYSGTGKGRYVNAIVLRTSLDANRDLIVSFERSEAAIFEIVINPKVY